MSTRRWKSSSNSSRPLGRYYREGQYYDVVIATGSALPQLEAGLVVIYGTEIQASDRLSGLKARSRQGDTTLSCSVGRIPLYRGALTFNPDDRRPVCHAANAEIAGLEFEFAGLKVIRMGYDLFAEVEFLLSKGQPVENARFATLELHIALLRALILGASIPVLEISPTPAGYDFAVCLTHDIDFVGIRRHKFDHTLGGFLCRSTVGALRDFLKRRPPWRDCSGRGRPLCHCRSSTWGG